MEQSKKTTILLSPELHERLTYLAQQRGVSLGKLVREACVQQYGVVDQAEQLAAVGMLQSLSLPVGAVRAMKLESVPAVDLDLG